MNYSFSHQSKVLGIMYPQGGISLKRKSKTLQQPKSSSAKKAINRYFGIEQAAPQPAMNLEPEEVHQQAIEIGIKPQLAVALAEKVKKERKARGPAAFSDWTIASYGPKKPTRKQLGLPKRSEGEIYAMRQAQGIALGQLAKERAIQNKLQPRFYKGEFDDEGLPKRNPNGTFSVRGGITKQRVQYALEKPRLSPKVLHALKFLGPKSTFDLAGFHKENYPDAKIISQGEMLDFLSMELKPWQSTHQKLAGHWALGRAQLARDDPAGQRASIRW